MPSLTCAFALAGAACLLVSGLCAWPASAAPPTAAPEVRQAQPREVAAPPVEELVAAALARSPALAALRADLEAARESEPPAATLPDPMVEAAFQNAGLTRSTVGKDESSMLGLEVRQGLPYPGKRAARLAAARAETAVRAAALARSERGTVVAVRTLYARLYALDGEAASLAAAHELLDLLAATAESRYTTGQGEQEALLKAQIEVSRLAERLAELGAQRAEAVAELNRLLDRAGGEALGRVAELPPVAVPPAPWEGLAVAGSAEVAMARADVEAASRRLTLARLDLRPDFSAAAGIGYRGSLDPMVNLSLGVELPLWRRRKQEPLVRAAEQELAATRHRLAAAEAAARAMAARLAGRWAAAEEQVRRLREGILPQTSAAIDAARASYLAGRGDFTTVIQDFGLWLEARKELAARAAERFTAWAELEELAARHPSGDLP
jgi:outer membrane protein, heavy metal efflux system